jgi:hypothetical protein
MTDIIPLDSFCSHKKMWEKCELLKSIVLAEKTVKERVGRKYVEKKALKFKTDKEVIDRIVRSAEHYKNLYLNEQIEKDRIEENLVFTIPNSVQFRDYQTKIIYDGAKILSEHGFLYLAMEVRTGKTLTSLGIASKTCIGNVLFLTKKKAMSSIEADYRMLAPMYDLTIMNYESLHKLPNDTKWELIICDEAHSCFLENTLIDGVKIKDIELGSYQKSFNFTKGVYEYRKVLNVFKNPLTENLVKIKCNGKEIVCTESHKIFTKRGWVKAGELLSTDELQIL